VIVGAGDVGASNVLKAKKRQKGLKSLQFYKRFAHMIKNKEPGDKPGKRNEKDFSETETGSDLDVPGAELDNKQENIGSEDEENNYYSLGGDRHDDLDEDKAGTRE